MSRALHDIRPDESRTRAEDVFGLKVPTHQKMVTRFLGAQGMKVAAGERGTVKTVFM